MILFDILFTLFILYIYLPNIQMAEIVSEESIFQRSQLSSMNIIFQIYRQAPVYCVFRSLDRQIDALSIEKA